MTAEKLLPEFTPPCVYEPLVYDVQAEAPLLSNYDALIPGRSPLALAVRQTLITCFFCSVDLGQTEKKGS